jgi:hypothetical protein
MPQHSAAHSWKSGKGGDDVDWNRRTSDGSVQHCQGSLGYSDDHRSDQGSWTSLSSVALVAVTEVVTRGEVERVTHSKILLFDLVLGHCRESDCVS